MGYSAYLLHHQHLARTPAVVQAWRDALMWVLAPPCVAQAGFGGQSGSGHSCGGGTGGQASGQQPVSDDIHPGEQANWKKDGGWAGCAVSPSSAGISLPLLPSPPTATSHAAGLLPPALRRAAAAALSSTPCTLHPAYLAFAPPPQWLEFIEDLLEMPGGLVRVQPSERRLTGEEQQAVLAALGASASPVTDEVEGGASDVSSVAAAQLCTLSVVDHQSRELSTLFEFIKGQLHDSQKSDHEKEGKAGLMSAAECVEAATALWEIIDAEWAPVTAQHAHLGLASPATSSSRSSLATLPEGAEEGRARAEVAAALAAAALPSSLLCLLRAAPLPARCGSAG